MEKLKDLGFNFKWLDHLLFFERLKESYKTGELNLGGFLNLYECSKFLCFVDLTYVKKLDLSYSNVSCLELNFLINLSDMKKLRVLSLCSTNIKDLSCLVNLENCYF